MMDSCPTIRPKRDVRKQKELLEVFGLPLIFPLFPSPYNWLWGQKGSWDWPQIRTWWFSFMCPLWKTRPFEDRPPLLLSFHPLWTWQVVFVFCLVKFYLLAMNRTSIKKNPKTKVMNFVCQGSPPISFLSLFLCYFGFWFLFLFCFVFE